MALNPSIFSDIETQANALKAENAIKLENFKESVDAYLMTWEDQPGGENIKVTISPSARNALIGASRLLSSTSPIVTVTKRDDVIATLGNDAVEAALNTAWKESSEINGAEVHLDAALSALLFGEVHLAVELTSETAARMKGAQGKAAKRMADKVVQRTPIRFRALNPQLGYVRRGAGGVAAYYRTEDVTRGELRTIFPEIAVGDDAKVVTLNEWWDLVYHIIWVMGDEPLLAVEHDLPFIPVVVTYSDGSSLFAKPEQNVQPFLYTFLKSGVHSRESLMLTVMYTKLFQFGMTPPLIVEGGNLGDTFRFDADQPLPVGYVPTGARVSYPMSNIIDPNVFKGLEVARGLGEQSTIFSQALGAPLTGGNNPFSTVALLSQAGRLPLTGPQKAVSKAIQEAMGISLEWLREEGTDHALFKDIDLEAEYSIDVKLDVQMPQDSIRNAQVGAQITSGPNAFVSKKWWYENAMGIRDTDKMRQEIAVENAYAAAFQTALQQQLQMQQQQAQAAMQPQGQPMPAGQGQPGAQTPDQAPQPQDIPQGMPGPDGALQQPLDPSAPGAAAMQVAPSPFPGMGGVNG